MSRCIKIYLTPDSEDEVQSSDELFDWLVNELDNARIHAELFLTNEKPDQIERSTRT